MNEGKAADRMKPRSQSSSLMTRRDRIEEKERKRKIREKGELKYGRRAREGQTEKTGGG